MRSMFIVEYRMSGRKISSMSIYADCLASALREFHVRMGANGCERNKYFIISHRQTSDKVTT
ncbi:hypothetical protein [Bremerella alba]|uniref:Uncharacterized protein n=1 Tax=Bremerella alba TaxID=980252 RepID=A0A7V8V2L6_9BACT|nr:hypothetical protein [Bremerella alba]MBA2113666.1 hypothetical protein [Bremerella alba]